MKRKGWSKGIFVIGGIGIVIGFLLFTSMAYAGEEVSGEEKVRNGGFEEGGESNPWTGEPWMPYEWTNFAAPGQTFREGELIDNVKNPLSGKHSLEINSKGNSQILYQRLSLTPGKIYRISYNVKGIAVEGSYITINIRQVKYTGKSDFSKFFPEMKDGCFTGSGKEGTFTFDFTSTIPSPYLVIQTGVAIHLIIDDISIKESSGGLEEVFKSDGTQNMAWGPGW